ncbi:MAG: transposase [Burkholderia sp.]
MSRQPKSPKLCLYIENEVWSICNNVCENSIRPFVLGRKN